MRPRDMVILTHLVNEINRLRIVAVDQVKARRKLRRLRRVLAAALKLRRTA